MGEIRILINAAIGNLERSKQDIYKQIENIILDCQDISEANHFLFHIDDCWYSIYFHARNKLKELSEHELAIQGIQDAVAEAHEVGEDTDGESVSDLMQEVNDPLIDIIAECWKQAGGNLLSQPAYITFHDSYCYWDIKQDRYVQEDSIEHLIS